MAFWITHWLCSFDSRSAGQENTFCGALDMVQLRFNRVITLLRCVAGDIPPKESGASCGLASIPGLVSSTLQIPGQENFARNKNGLQMSKTKRSLHCLCWTVSPACCL